MGEGETTTRVNHNSSGCSGSSKSLQITRQPDGTITAYCHRCEQKGYYQDRSYKGFNKGIRFSRETKDVYLPKDMDMDVDNWASPARVWAFKNRLESVHIERANIGYSESIGRILIPTYHEGKVSGYQARKVHKYDEGPKYYTRCNKTLPNYNHYHNTGSKTIVITEDSISAVRLSNFVDSISLQGVVLKDNVLSYLLGYRKYDKCFVWLDNDTPLVIQKRVVLKNRLSNYLECSTITIQEEPKHMDDAKLHKFLISKGIV